MSRSQAKKYWQHPPLGRTGPLLLLLWLGVTLFPRFVGEEYEAENQDQINLRFVERELLLLEAGCSLPPVMRWLLGAGNSEENYESLRTLMATDVSEPNWQVECARKVISYKLARCRGEVTPVPGDEFFDDETLLEQEYPAYVYQAVLQVRDSAAIEAHLAVARETVLRRAFLSLIPWLVFWGCGLFFIGWLVLKRPQSQGRSWRILSAWHPGVVLSVFAISSLAGDQIYDIGALLLILLGTSSEASWTTLEVLWRALPALALTWYFLGAPESMVRVFGIGRKPEWRSMFGLIGILMWLGIILWNLGIRGELDPSDYFETPDPTMMQIVNSVLNGVIAAPLFEEIVFRGFLFLGLAHRLGVMPAAVLSSTLFAFIHHQYDWVGVAQLGIFGLICCWLTWRTRSLSSAIVLHAIYNADLTWWAWLTYQKPLF